LRFKLQKNSQLFTRVHNETLSIVAMRVCNPDRLSVGINRLDAAPTPSCFAEIVGDNFPIPHAPPQHSNEVPEGTIKVNDQPDRWDSPRTRLGQD
jgi:hypothetical protein